MSRVLFYVDKDCCSSFIGKLEQIFEENNVSPNITKAPNSQEGKDLITFNVSHYFREDKESGDCFINHEGDDVRGTFAEESPETIEKVSKQIRDFDWLSIGVTGVEEIKGNGEERLINVDIKL